MKSIEEKLKTILSGIYCDDCANNFDDDPTSCEGCHRKCMMWIPSDACIKELIQAVKG